MLQLLRIGLMTRQLPKSAALLALLLGALELGTAGLLSFRPAPAAAVTAAAVTPEASPSPVVTATAGLPPLPTATLLPSPTPAPPTPTATPAGWDAWEPNDSLQAAATVHVNERLEALTLAPAGDEDAFKFYAKAGQLLMLATFVREGSDTRLRLYSEAGTLLAENDDRSATDLGSAILWPVPADGWLTLVVGSAVPGAGGSYDLALYLEAPTPTPPPGPTPVPPTVAPTATGTPAAVPDDAYEPNNEPGAAAAVVPGESLQATLPQGDVDYFRLLAKAGNRYRCETAPDGVDTALSVYGAAGTLLAGNDDRAAGDIGSAAEWAAAETGEVILAVSGRAGRGPYRLTCAVLLPPTPPPPAAGGQPQAPPPTATAIPAGAAALSVRFLGQATAEAAPADETVVRLVVVYDRNNNRVADSGEGIRNISVRALYGGRVVAWGLTDERGEVTLRITGPVERVTIPYFNFWELRLRPGEVMEPRTVIVPPVPLPLILPVETPRPEAG